MFFFNDTATTEIYTLSLPDPLPIFAGAAGTLRGRLLVELRAGLLGRLGQLLVRGPDLLDVGPAEGAAQLAERVVDLDRKSTRLNSSHANISYAVFCLKKKKK